MLVTINQHYNNELPLGDQISYSIHSGAVTSINEKRSNLIKSF